MSWVIHVSVNYTTEIVKEHLENVFGDYRYTGNDIGFLRSNMIRNFEYQARANNTEVIQILL